MTQPHFIFVQRNIEYRGYLYSLGVDFDDQVWGYFGDDTGWEKVEGANIIDANKSVERTFDELDEPPVHSMKIENLELI